MYMIYKCFRLMCFCMLQGQEMQMRHSNCGSCVWLC